MATTTGGIEALHREIKEVVKAFKAHPELHKRRVPLLKNGALHDFSERIAGRLLASRTLAYTCKVAATSEEQARGALNRPARYVAQHDSGHGPYTQMIGLWHPPRQPAKSIQAHHKLRHQPVRLWQLCHQSRRLPEIDAIDVFIFVSACELDKAGMVFCQQTCGCRTTKLWGREKPLGLVQAWEGPFSTTS